MIQSTGVQGIFWRMSRLFIVTMLLVLANNGVWQPAVQALVFQVDTTEDNGALTNCDDAVEEDCSLRGAITRANNNAGADTITFAVPDGATIVLGGAAGDDDNDSGDLDILDNGDLTIQGNGAVNTIIDGDGNDRVFHVCPDGCANSVTLMGLTIGNGAAGIGGGGGILNNGATLSVQNSTIGGAGFGNWAMIAGGGLYNEAGTTIVDGSTVSANSAGFLTFSGFGGGINNHDTFIVQNGSVIGEAGVANRADHGGGIYNSGTMTVEGSIVISNTADHNGGGIYNNEGTTTVDGSTISANTAVTEGGGICNHATLIVQNGSVIGGAGGANEAIYGGGIYNHQGTTTVDGSVVSANRAGDDGGGIYNEATLNVENGSVIGGAGGANEATGSGGGIFNAQGGTATIEGSTVTANTADDNGGGIYNWDTLNVEKGSSVSANTADTGGGILNYAESTTTVDGSAVSANQARHGGGFQNAGSGTLIIQNGSAIGGTGVGNQAAVDGGGIINWGTLTVTGSIVSVNTAGRWGGGIYSGAGTTTVTGSTVSANSADDGGGIFNHATLIVQNGSIIGGSGAGNQATHFGGGIYTQFDGATTVDDSTVSANMADCGGGLFSTDSGTTMVTGSRILDNTATTNGGGVYHDTRWDGATDVTDSCIIGNSDTSFFNNRTAEQTAIGNWWGAATGPNTPGADTVSDNVDTSGYLTAPILGCPAPDLQVNKANDAGGEGMAGTPFTWTLTVSNTGGVDAAFSAGQSILEDELPAGPVYGPPVPGSMVGITNGEAIDCRIEEETLTCQAAGDGDVIVGAGGGFAVAFSATPSVTGVLTNPVGTCRVDPDEHVAEMDETNNDCPADSVEVAAWGVYLPQVLRSWPTAQSR